MAAGTALITGASNGLGRHLAHEFARNGHPVLLMADDQDDVDGVAADIERRYQIRALGIACDIGQDDALDKLSNRLHQLGIAVDILVNNAGHGARGAFLEQSIDEHLAVVRATIDTVLRLTRQFLPAMRERGRGRILNTASTAAFEAGPQRAVYHACQAFVLSWSESLALELESTPVTVTALCPPVADTETFAAGGMLGARSARHAHRSTAQAAARAGYAGLMRGESLVIPGASDRTQVFSQRFMADTLQGRHGDIAGTPSQRHARGRPQPASDARHKSH